MFPQGPTVLIGPSELLEEPGALRKPLQCLVGRHDLLAQLLVAASAEGHVLAHQFVLLDELAHLDVGEPEVMPGDGGVQGATGVEDAAAGGAADGLLVGEGLAEAGVAGLDVCVYGPVGDTRGADGTGGVFGHGELLQQLGGRLFDGT